MSAYLSRRQKSSNGRHRARLAAQHGLEAFFHQLFAHPINHGWAGFQSFNDPVVAPPFASFRDIGRPHKSAPITGKTNARLLGVPSPASTDRCQRPCWHLVSGRPPPTDQRQPRHHQCHWSPVTLRRSGAQWRRAVPPAASGNNWSG